MRIIQALLGAILIVQVYSVLRPLLGSVRIERAWIGSDSGHIYWTLVRRISEDGQPGLA